MAIDTSEASRMPVYNPGKVSIRNSQATRELVVKSNLRTSTDPIDVMFSMADSAEFIYLDFETEHYDFYRNPMSMIIYPEDLPGLLLVQDYQVRLAILEDIYKKHIKRFEATFFEMDSNIKK